jgi:hypothetical protein
MPHAFDLCEPFCLAAAGISGASLLRPWQPFNDPTPIGWIITLSYAIGSAACFFAYKKETELAREDAARYRPKLWLAFSIALLAFALNKQLDLQIIVTNLGRKLFFLIGLYARRRAFQAVFVAGVALVGLAAAFAVIAYTRRAGLRYLVPFVGLVYLICFVVIRAASFHHVDVLLGTRLEYMKVNAALELLGILLIGGAALHRTVSFGFQRKT